MILTAVAALTVYAVIVAALLVGNHRWHRAQARREAVNWLPYLPPVPPSASPEPRWFDGMPADILSDDTIRPLFDDIVRGQFDGRRTT